MGLYYNGESIFPIKPKYKIVTFADGTDEEISTMLEAYYRGDINIADYWNVGDTRKIHLTATTADGGTTHTANHAAQDVTLVILDFNHDDLTEPINGISKAAVTVGLREMLGNVGNWEPEYWQGRNYLNSSDESNYIGNNLRTYLNKTFFNSMPTSFSNMIKTVDKKCLKYHTVSTDAPLIASDKCWLLSYPEVWGKKVYRFYLDGTAIGDWEGYQYEYYKTASVIKFANNNGEAGGTARNWWLRSPCNYSDYDGKRWCSITSSGNASFGKGNEAIGIIPAFCI